MPINGDSPRDWVPRPPAHLGKTAVKQGLLWRGKITGLDDGVHWDCLCLASGFRPWK
jgi:hypothetical protein